MCVLCVNVQRKTMDKRRDAIAIVMSRKIDTRRWQQQQRQQPVCIYLIWLCALVVNGTHICALHCVYNVHIIIYRTHHSFCRFLATSSIYRFLTALSSFLFNSITFSLSLFLSVYTNHALITIHKMRPTK